MKTYTFLLLVLSLIFLGTLTTLAIEPIPISQNYQYMAILSGDEAIPPQNTGAFGKAYFSISQDMDQITYQVEVYNIYDVLMVTLRLGSPGKEGSLIVWLFPENPPPTPLKYKGLFEGVLAEGIITEDRLAGRLKGFPLFSLVQEIENGRVFVQVDTLLHQIGELRGQLLPNP
ncbi:CHRD domain-containing protein [Atribacter laminatus]|uniref:CHRD domain-containing protein n=1 Tax=Atribacter laminatus TaxID=2847778 RepID=A0A7T1F2I5_ATRLM|nr:CHRD domain-containing protein [Atribacter laminatus]QPM68048.1 hypothetical protein RT761_01262 [Atribacter laminatus]